MKVARVAIIALISLSMISAQCAARSVKGADDAIRTGDDLLKASVNVADDFGRSGALTADDLARYTQAVPDPAAPMKTRVAASTASLQRSGDNAVSDEVMVDVSCAVAEFYLEYGTLPTAQDVASFIEEYVRGEAYPNVALAEGAIDVVEGVASGSTYEQFVAAVNAACLF